MNHLHLQCGLQSSSLDSQARCAWTAKAESYAQDSSLWLPGAGISGRMRVTWYRASSLLDAPTWQASLLRCLCAKLHMQYRHRAEQAQPGMTRSKGPK